MKIILLTLLITLTGSAVWAQKYPKRPANAAAANGTVHSVSLHIRSLKARPRVVTPGQAAPGPAAGVAQCYVDPNGSFSGFFVNTATIPSGSNINGFVTLLDDSSSIDFTGETLQQSMPVGSLVYLPTITNFGDLFLQSGAALDFAIQIQPPNGATTEVDCVALVGEAYANSDLAGNEPLISTVAQSVAGNNDLNLVLNGYFTPDPAQVVLTDLYNIYVVPAGAVSLVSGGQINVDLSQISGLDLTSSDTLFVTVSQDGYSDTVEHRYLPGTPGSFNPAPQ